jgi:hypothetical protein
LAGRWRELALAAVDRELGHPFNFGVNREAIETLGKESLIRLILARAETIAANRTVRNLVCGARSSVTL